MANKKILLYGLAVGIVLSTVYHAHGKEITVGYVKVEEKNLVVLDRNQVELGTVSKDQLCATLAKNFGGGEYEERVKALFTKSRACNDFPETRIGNYFRIVASLGFFSILNSIRFLPIYALTNEVALVYLYKGDKPEKIVVRRVESAPGEEKEFLESDKNVFQTVLEAVFGDTRQVDLTARKLKVAVEEARKMAKDRGGLWLVTITSSYNVETGVGGIRAVPSNVGKIPTRPVAPEKAIAVVVANAKKLPSAVTTVAGAGAVAVPLRRVRAARPRGAPHGSPRRSW